MRNINVDEPISKLEIDKNVIQKLAVINIMKVNDLWLKTRKELKNLGFTDSEINHIRIKMQLWGLDLNKKMYI